MKFEEFKNLVKHGMEYNFFVEGKEYWISYNSDGFYLTRVEDEFTQEFSSSENLFAKARINGKSLEQLWSTIEQYC